MLKSDHHMEKVKTALVFEQQKMKAFEARKAAKLHGKFQKGVQNERKKEKAARKRESNDAIDDWKRKKARGGTTGEGRAADLEKVLSQGADSKARRGKYSAQSRAKREGFDKRYGNGKRNRMSKRNTAESTREGLSFKRNRSGRGGGRGGGRLVSPARGSGYRAGEDRRRSWE